MSDSKSEAAKPLLTCSSCGRRCKPLELTPGCRSAKCHRCYVSPAHAAASTHTPAKRKRSQTPATPVPAGKPNRRRPNKIPRGT
jgi:hypothetical protein